MPIGILRVVWGNGVCSLPNRLDVPVDGISSCTVLAGLIPRSNWPELLQAVPRWIQVPRSAECPGRLLSQSNNSSHTSELYRLPSRICLSFKGLGGRGGLWSWDLLSCWSHGLQNLSTESLLPKDYSCPASLPNRIIDSERGSDFLQYDEPRMALHGPDGPPLQKVSSRPVLKRCERLLGLPSRKSLSRAP